MTRQIVLDTETTGIDTNQDHRIIEIGAVEMINRRVTGNNFHHYLQPDREIDAGAMEVHGITQEFLQDKPRFADVVDAFLEYVKGAELIIHNAPFDIGFLNHELKRLNKGHGNMADYCTVLDTLALARKLHPGQKNNLDALCRRYDISNDHRTLHGALLDSEILADVYLAMTGGQVMISLDDQGEGSNQQQVLGSVKKLGSERQPLKVVRASDEELQQHFATLARIDKASDGSCLWLHGAKESESH